MVAGFLHRSIMIAAPSAPIGVGNTRPSPSFSHILHCREVVKSLKLRTNSSSGSQPAAAGSPEPDVSAGITSSNVSGVVVLSFTCAIPDRQRLMKAYERSPYPPMVRCLRIGRVRLRMPVVTTMLGVCIAEEATGWEEAAYGRSFWLSFKKA